MTVKLMTELDLAGKRVLIREDLNVPIKDGSGYQRCANQSRTAKHSAGAESRCQGHTDVPFGTTH